MPDPVRPRPDPIAALVERWREPVDSTAFGLVTSHLIYEEARKECADQLEAALRADADARPPQELTFQEVADASRSRANRWHVGGLTDWSALEWAGAMAGEAGEACNAAKKLKRIEDRIANINTEEGRSLTDHDAACLQIGKEVADTVLYGFCLAARVGVPLAPVLIEAFNRKSEEYGFPERIGSAAVLRRAEWNETTRRLARSTGDSDDAAFAEDLIRGRRAEPLKET